MPRAQNPWNDLLDTRRWRKSGNLAQLKTKLWKVIIAFEKGLDASMERNDEDGVKRWGIALSQIAWTYVRLVSESDMERKLETLEKEDGTPV